MAVTVNVNGGTIVTLGTGTTVQAAQQLSTAELLTEVPTSDVATYGGATTTTGQAKRVFHAVGYQDWNAAGSVCQFLEDNAGTWQPIVYDQYGGGAPSASNPVVNGEILCVPPKRGGTVDQPEDFDITMGLKAYAVDDGTP